MRTVEEVLREALAVAIRTERLAAFDAGYAAGERAGAGGIVIYTVEKLQARDDAGKAWVQALENVGQ